MRLLVTQLAGCIAGFACVDDDHRKLFVDKRVRTVLHFTGGITLGVDIADLLQLQRTLERDRKIYSPAEVQKILYAEKLLRQFFDRVGLVQKLFHLQRKLGQVLYELLAFIRRDRASKLAEVECEQVERYHLRRKCLCRGDTDFGSGVSQDRSVRLS